MVSRSGRATRRVPNPLPGAVRDLEEAKRILEGLESTALSGVVLVLTEVAERRLFQKSAYQSLHSRDPIRARGLLTARWCSSAYSRLPCSTALDGICDELRSRLPCAPNQVASSRRLRRKLRNA